MFPEISGRAAQIVLILASLLCSLFSCKAPILGRAAMRNSHFEHKYTIM